MNRFRKGKVQVLVSTVVIEVGVDVPNATVMVIEHAERYGLAQLHQLRGRIGRGSQTSYCLLFAAPATEEAQRRLDCMVSTTDGFRIAEEDLRLRGPGEFFGTRQHGLPGLRVGDIINDFALLQLARRDAFKIARDDPDLSKPAHAPAREALHAMFRDRLELIQVG
jgi:ATP-dependent DNA helicase RecG